MTSTASSTLLLHNKNNHLNGGSNHGDDHHSPPPEASCLSPQSPDTPDRKQTLLHLRRSLYAMQSNNNNNGYTKTYDASLHSNAQQLLAHEKNLESEAMEYHCLQNLVQEATAERSHPSSSSLSSAGQLSQEASSARNLIQNIFFASNRARENNPSKTSDCEMDPEMGSSEMLLEVLDLLAPPLSPQEGSTPFKQQLPKAQYQQLEAAMAFVAQQIMKEETTLPSVTWSKAKRDQPSGKPMIRRNWFISSLVLFVVFVFLFCMSMGPSNRSNDSNLIQQEAQVPSDPMTEYEHKMRYDPSYSSMMESVEEPETYRIEDARSYVVKFDGESFPVMSKTVDEPHDFDISAGVREVIRRRGSNYYGENLNERSFQRDKLQRTGGERRLETFPGSINSRLVHRQKQHTPSHRNVPHRAPKDHEPAPSPSVATVDENDNNNDDGCHHQHVLDSAQFGELEDIRRCLARHPKWINWIDENGWTALHEASYAGWREVVEFLVQAGASLFMETYSGHTAFELALHQLGPMHEVTKFLQLHAPKDFNLGLTFLEASPKDESGDVSNESSTTTSNDHCPRSQFQWLAYSGDLDGVKRCLNHHPDLIHQTDLKGWTAIHEASRSGHVNVVEYLLQSGANVHAKTLLGHSALDLATEMLGKDHTVTQFLLHYDNVSIQKVMPEHLSDPESATNNKDNNDGAKAADNSTPTDSCSPNQFQWLAYTGHFDELKRCLSLHPDLLNRADGKGWTLIHEASRAGHSHIVEYLLQLGANPEAKTELGHTALDLATEYHGKEHAAAQMLLHHIPQLQLHGPDPSSAASDNQKENDELPIHEAASNHKGGGSTQNDSCASDEVQWSAHFGEFDNLKRCLSLHPDFVNRADPQGWTPIHEAARNGHSKIVDYLLHSGANADAKTTLGKSALDLAMEFQGEDHAVTQILLRHHLKPLQDATKPSPAAAGDAKVQQNNSIIPNAQDHDGSAIATDPSQGRSETTTGVVGEATATTESNATAETTATAENSATAETTATAENSTPEDNCSPDEFQWLAHRGNFDELRQCLSRHPDLINRVDNQGWTPLHEASRAGHPDIVEYLVRSGANINAKTSLGHTALDLAMEYQGMEHSVTQTLLRHSPKEDATTPISVVDAPKSQDPVNEPQSRTDESTSKQAGNAQETAATVKGAGVSHGVVAEQSSQDDQCAPEEFQWLAHRGNLDKLRRCLSLRPDLLNHADKQGWSAIHEASRAGHADVVECLLQSGANVMAKTVLGHSAMDLAMEYLGVEHAVTKMIHDHMPQHDGSDPTPIRQLHHDVAGDRSDMDGPDSRGNSRTVTAETTNNVSNNTLSANTQPAEPLTSTSNEFVSSSSSSSPPEQHFDCETHDYLLFAITGQLDDLKRCLSLHPDFLNCADDQGWTAAHESARFGHVPTLEYLLQAGATVTLLNSDGLSTLNVARVYQGENHAVTRMLEAAWPRTHP